MDAVIYALITICVIVAVVYVILWVLGQLGIPLPEKAVRIMWVIVGLLCFLVLWHLLGGLIHLPVLR